MKHTEEYLQAKWVTENPDGYDERDVVDAKRYCNAYLDGYNQALLKVWNETLQEQLRIGTVSGCCFGRISENVFNDLKSLDDLITKMGTTKDGYKNIGVGEPDDFKSRLKHFKEFLKKELPEFTEEEILKFDKYFLKFRKIYKWYGFEYLLTALEYEVRTIA